MVTTRMNRQQIVRDPQVHGGEPVLHGTRVPVRSIILSLQEDYPNDPLAVAIAYGISAADVETALVYYRANKAEIDRIISQHEHAAYAE